MLTLMPPAALVPHHSQAMFVDFGMAVQYGGVCLGIAEPLTTC
jgi:hypothetical protein